MAKRRSGFRLFSLCLLLFLCGVAAGFALHERAVRLLLGAVSFGVMDLSDSPPVRLAESLVLRTLDEGEPGGVLPAGSVLYPESAYSEGFVRYSVTINVEVPFSYRDPGFGREVTEPLWGAPLSD